MKMHKKAIVEDYDLDQQEAGTWLTIYVPNWTPNYKLASHCEIRFDDGREISIDQRKLLYALFLEICRWSGHELEEIKLRMKINFMLDRNKDYFSLANVNVTIAKEFIEYVLEFVFFHAIPLKRKIKALAKEVNNYLYLCLLNRSCAECGNLADIHHVNAVGMGRNRSGIDHTRHELIALCRKHHNEAHNIGWLTFKKKYHLEAITLNEEAIKKIGL